MSCALHPVMATVLGLLVLAAPRAGHAQSAASAAAEELFQEGRRDFEAHDWEGASAKLTASLRLEPAVGTLISLAECDEARNHLAAARQHWLEAADLAEAKSDVLRRGAFARQRFAAVDLRVPRLLVRLAPSAPPDTVFQCDGVALTGALNIALLVDPGAHAVVVVAPGHEARLYDVALAEGQYSVLVVEPGGAVQPPPAPRPSAPVAPATASSMAPAGAAPATSLSIVSGAVRPGETPSSRWGAGTRRTVAYVVVGGAGLVGGGAGAYFGLRAFSEWSAAKADCRLNCVPGSTAQGEQAEAGRLADLSTVAFSVAGMALVTAAVLWITAPDRSARFAVGPAIDRRAAGFAVHGAW